MVRLFFVLALGLFLASFFGRSQDKSAGQVTNLFVRNSEKLNQEDVIVMHIFYNRLVDPPQTNIQNKQTNIRKRSHKYKAKCAQIFLLKASLSGRVWPVD